MGGGWFAICMSKKGYTEVRGVSAKAVKGKPTNPKPF